MVKLHAVGCPSLMLLLFVSPSLEASVTRGLSLECLSISAQR